MMTGLVSAIGLLATVASVLPSARPAQTKPNVIVVLTDDQGYGDMACHGNPWLKTPNLDRLYSESVRLEDYHVDPVCTPTRAALMTGRSCIRVGAWTVTEGRQLLHPGEKTMADVFVASGYRTAMFGKWHLGDTYPYAPRYRGFQEVVCHRAGGVDEIGNPSGNDYFDDTYFRNGKPERFKGYCTDVFFTEALTFIKQAYASNSQKPFFVYLSLNAMHSPFTVAEKYSLPYTANGIPKQRAIFYGMIANFDENLGRLMNALKAQGLDRNTMLIFMGDNGSAAGGGGRNPDDGFNAGMRGTKGSVYEGGHRVACFVRWPARLKGGRRIHHLTAHVDWLPTLIELCGLTPPEGVVFDGRSLASLLDGRAHGWPERTLCLSRQADQLRKWRPAGSTMRYPQVAVLTETWRMVNGELYDMLTDPGQTKNVAATFPEVVTRLSDAYSAWFDDVTGHRGAFSRFFLGAPQENPTVFTVRDWHPTRGRVIWKPSLLPDDSEWGNGFWAVHIVRPGNYAFRLSRYPLDAPKPMGSNRARIKIGNLEQTKRIGPGDKSVTFVVDLKQGPAILQTWLRDAKTGKERGAYYVKVEKRHGSSKESR